MPPLSTIFVGLQGAFGVLNRAASLLFRSAAEKNVEILKVPSIPAIHAIAAGSISIGAFYLNTALRHDTTMMWWCVVGRLIAIPVFLQHGGPWRNVAVFEAACGLLTMGGLLWDSWRDRGTKEKGP
ncbi:uncharacterized protein LY89DRAFT_376667 [Mollisia scopiformis]|uniref:Uncharacterized protein n=1 Tax=Mollisia scopiformis TaxID=149040 RepID=A0A194XN55_MOLSC|nr:uncharacterized protein LY89DRAFT_376667 [Mollisia scopiformis]KUJ21524.1 hypothetical protein LY89DRAFT_376667 [Mollisia scopiformis]